MKKRKDDKDIIEEFESLFRLNREPWALSTHDLNILRRVGAI